MNYEQVALALGRAEQATESGNSAAKCALVEIGKIDSLIEAYPNYFGDVTLFIRNLRHVCDGQQAIEYSIAKQQMVPRSPPEKPDYRIFNRRRQWWFPR
jgi:hypothetical protein